MLLPAPNILLPSKNFSQNTFVSKSKPIKIHIMGLTFHTQNLLRVDPAPNLTPTVTNVKCHPTKKKNLNPKLSHSIKILFSFSIKNPNSPHHTKNQWTERIIPITR